ncbi:MAG: Short C-terminal domain, partial [Proteobacteria bacterium]|nr:Short C-terminal domain [Pseudomonadota bacterium]
FLSIDLKGNPMNRILLSTSALLLALTLSGCGGDETVIKNVSQQSTGQQLLSLKEALDKGIITQDQYEQQKAVILKNSK